MVRLFAAIEAPPDIAEELASRQYGLASARWRPPDSLHVTLRFFGEMQETVAADLDAELARVAAKPFDLTLAGVGAFGEGHQLRAVWAGLTESEPLRRLAGRCETAARRAGLRLEARTYRPHITLAYLGVGAEPVAVAGWIRENALLRSPPWRVSRFGLYSSRRTAEGSRYVLEGEYPFG